MGHPAATAEQLQAAPVGLIKSAEAEGPLVPPLQRRVWLVFVALLLAARVLLQLFFAPLPVRRRLVASPIVCATPRPFPAKLLQFPARFPEIATRHNLEAQRCSFGVELSRLQRLKHSLHTDCYTSGRALC